MQVDHDSGTAGEVLRQLLGAIGRTVLAAGTAERHLQVGESAADEALHMCVHQREYMAEESEYLPVGLEELLNFPVEAGHGAEPLVLARVMHRTAVEDISSPVSGQVLRNPLLEGETVDVHMQETVGGRRQSGTAAGKFAQHSGKIRIGLEGFCRLEL